MAVPASREQMHHSFRLALQWISRVFQTSFSTQDVGEYGGDYKFKQFKEKALVEVMCCEIWYHLFNSEILNSVFKISKVLKQVLHMTHGLQFGHP